MATHAKSTWGFLGLFLCSVLLISLFFKTLFFPQKHQTYLCTLLFQMNFRIGLCNSKRNPIGILIRIVLNEMLISCPIYEHIIVHLLYTLIMFYDFLHQSLIYVLFHLFLGTIKFSFYYEQYPFSCRLLLLYRNAIAFCMLILYSAIMLTSFIIYNTFENSWILKVHNHIIFI